MFSYALAPYALKFCIRCFGSLFLRRIGISTSYYYSLFSFTGNQLFPTVFPIGLYGLLFFHVLDKLTDTPVPTATTKQVSVAAWHKAAQSYVVPLPNTHRFSCQSYKKISPVIQFSHLVFLHMLPSPYLALHEVLLSANLLCTVPFSLQKQSKNRHIEPYLFVFLLCIWKVSGLSLGLKNV